MSESVKVERRGHVLEVTLDRPKVNAIDRLTSIALGEAFVQLRDDPELRVAIITAAGDRIFSAGWDLKAAGEVEEVGEWWKLDYGPGSFAVTREIDDRQAFALASNPLEVLGCRLRWNFYVHGFATLRVQCALN